MQDYKIDLLKEFPKFIDKRGSLIVWEYKELPFVPARTFMISNVPKGQVRANHSVSCNLIIFAIVGSVEVVLDRNYTVLINKKNKGLLIKENTYIELKKFSADSILLVFAEKSFSETRYSFE